MIKKEKKEKSKNKKCIFIIIGLIILGIGGYFGYKYFEFKKPIEEKWGETYYVYLKDIKENAKKAGLPDKLNNAKIGFYDVISVKDPIMVIEYEKNKETYSNIYYIENDKVNNIIYNEPTEIEFLYNIEEKKYDYYAHIEDDESDTYTKVSDKVNKKEETKDYTFKKDEKDSVTDINGKELSIEKKDEIFVETDSKATTEDWDNFLKDQVLKDILKRLVKNHKSQKDIEKEVEKEVNKKVEAVEKQQEEMKNAQVAVDKKLAEEEAQRKAEEEAKGLQVGSQRVKYGTYRVYDPRIEQETGRFTINADGTYHLSGEKFSMYNLPSDGKYFIGEINISQYEVPQMLPAVCFGKGEYSSCIGFPVYNNNFADNYEMIEYIG